MICRAEIFPDRSGKLSSLLGSHIDITDRNAGTGHAGLDSSLREKLEVRMERIVAELEEKAASIRSNFRGDSMIVERIQELERLSSSFACLNEVIQLDAKKGDHGLEALELSKELRTLYLAQKSLLPERVELDVEAIDDIRLYGLTQRSLSFVLTEAIVCVSEKVTPDFKSRIHVIVSRGSESCTDGHCPSVTYSYTGEPLSKTELLALSKTPHVKVSSHVEGAHSILSLVFECELRPTVSNLDQGEQPLVLLAEDEGVLRLAIRTMLESIGYDVVVTKDGAEAVNAFARSKSRFSLALVDLQMPKVDGYGVVASIRASTEDLPIIRMSGDSNDERTQLLDEVDDCSVFLSKPFGISDLKLAIQELKDRVKVSR